MTRDNPIQDTAGPGIDTEGVTLSAKQNYDIYLKSGDWTYESLLPDVVESLLPLRLSYKDYLDEQFMRTYKTKHNAEPECRFSGSREGCLCVPRFFSPVMSFPTVINDDWYSMRVCDEEGIEGMLRSLSVMGRSTSRWYFGCATISRIDGSDPDARRLIDCYQSRPIHAFTDVAKWEMPSRTTGPDIWAYIYDDLEYSVRKPGIFGTLHDNSLIDIRPYDSKDALGSCSRDIKARRTSDQWSGFIDCTYTAFSLEAGRMRSLVHGCRYRVMTERTLSQARQMIETLGSCDDDEPRDWLFHFHCKMHPTSWGCVSKCIRLWRSLRWHNAPGLHVFEDRKVISLHVSSGCLVKPISRTYGISREFDDTEACWVDSLCYNDEAMFRLLLSHERIGRGDVSDNVRTILHLFPFFADDQPPRPSLGSVISTQAMCKPRVELTSTMAPSRQYDPIVRTPLMHKLVTSMDGGRPITVPGVPLLVVFANMRYNYEDSVIVNQSVNEMRLFEYDSVIYHPVPERVKAMKPGQTIREDQTWFRPHCDADVIREGVSKRMSRYVVARMNQTGLTVGDKLATSHGQKFTVSKITNERDMPTFVCNDTGRTITPHLIVASSSVHNRGTMGQLYEAWAGMECVEDPAFDPRTNDRWCVYDPFEPEHVPSRTFSCSISNGGEMIRGPGERVLSCDYGICHIWLLSHVCRDKQHYVSRIPRGSRPMKGKLRGSGVRFGEMECLSMMSGGLINCLSYLSDSSDLVSVDICSKCRRLILHCCCESSHGSTTCICVRESLVRFDILRTNYSLNGYLGINAGSMDTTAIEGRHSSVPFIPESFVYEV